MKYTFMHKTKEVLNMEIDEETGNIKKIMDIFSPEHLPFGVTYRDNKIERKKLNDWWINRSIPASREKIQGVLQELNITSSQQLLVKCFGLSLSDQYWVKPFNSNLKWESINFFENDFSEDIGDILVGNKRASKQISMISPDNTSEGNLRKRWKIIDGERILLKGGSGVNRQEVFNEKIASEIMRCLNINHVIYEIYWDKNIPYCGCKDFITVNEDFVSAWRLISSIPKANNMSEYNHLIMLCEKNGIKNIKKSLDEMLVLDFIISNEDRHFNNFGFIRDANTLEFRGFAPIFDSGSSLGFDTPTKLLNEYKHNWKPFMHGNIITQLDLISNFDWINFEKLKDVYSIITNVFSESNGFIDKERANAIADKVSKQIVILEEYASKKIKHKEVKKYEN